MEARHTYHGNMIELVDLCYARIGTKDLNATQQFATNKLGLQLVRCEEDRLYVRCGERDHDICYLGGDPNIHVLGFEVQDETALKAAYEQLTQTGLSVVRGTDQGCSDRRVLAFIEFEDPTGNKFELVVRPDKATRRYFPSRDAGITEFSHVGLRTTDARRDEEFWTANFNIRANDWIGDAGLLSFDSVHHRIALFPAEKQGIQHINLQVESLDDVMRSYYFLREQQIKIVFGPGRHATSGATFLYFEGPDGMVYEYSHGVKIIDDPNYRPRQFPFTPEAFCVWGAKPDIPEFRE